jgi:resuscitation-promoting factor RpfC
MTEGPKGSRRKECGVYLRIARGLPILVIFSTMLIIGIQGSSSSDGNTKNHKIHHLKPAKGKSLIGFSYTANKIPLLPSTDRQNIKATTTTTTTASTTTTTTTIPIPVTTTTTIPISVTTTTTTQPVQSASVANSATWNCIIWNESRGDPTAVNSSSGAGGLFQFLPSSWVAYGGLKYASLPEYASVSEQWDIALTAQAESGWTPWVGDGCTPIG